MAHEPRFRIIRLTLVADTVTPIYPARQSDVVEIINDGNDEMYLYTTVADAQTHQHYIRVPVGIERPTTLPGRSPWTIVGQMFHPDHIAFWVKTPQAGEVAFVWY